MDIQKNVPGLSERVGSTVSQTLLDSEIPLPEGREAARVLLSHAQLSVDEAVTLEGVVKAGGRLSLQLLCVDMEGEPFGFSASSAYTHEIPMEGAENGMEAVVTAQLIECRCKGNGTRLHLAAVLELEAQVSAPVQTPVITELKAQTEIETRLGTVKKRKRTQLAEHTMHISEEIAAPNAAEVLLYTGAAETREISFSGNSVSLEGGLYIKVLAASAEGQMSVLTETLPFTDVFQAEYAPETWAEVALEQLSVASADENFGVADVEATLHIRLFGVESEDYSVLLDAYDSEGAFTAEQTEIRQMLCLGAEQRRISLRENVQIPIELPEAYRMIAVTTLPAVTGTFEKDGKLGVDAMLFTSVLYQCDGGELHAFTEDIPIQLQLESPYGTENRIVLRCLSAEASGSGRTPEIQFLLEALLERYEDSTVRVMTDVREGGAPIPYTGILIYLADAGDTLWTIGKRFGVPLGKLPAWNGTISEPLHEGQQIVLLR